MKWYVCFGGPRDGEQVFAPPTGYREYGRLVVWHAIKITLVPFWQAKK